MLTALLSQPTLAGHAVRNRFLFFLYIKKLGRRVDIQCSPEELIERLSRHHS